MIELDVPPDQQSQALCNFSYSKLWALQVGQLSFNGRGNFLLAIATDMEHSVHPFSI